MYRPKTVSPIMTAIPKWSRTLSTTMTGRIRVQTRNGKPISVKSVKRVTPPAINAVRNRDSTSTRRERVVKLDSGSGRTPDWP